MASIERLEWDADGAAAARRLRERGVYKYSADEYTEEFKAVQRERAERENRDRGEVAGYIANTAEAMGGARKYAQAAAAVIQGDLRKFALSGTTSLHRLAGILVALRDPTDGKIPTDVAVDLLGKLPDDVMAAAGQRLQDLASAALVNTGLSYDAANLQKALIEVRKQQPDLARAADNGGVSRALLDQLFWPENHVFK